MEYEIRAMSHFTPAQWIEFKHDLLTQEEAAGTGSEVSRVQVFGRVQRVYPGYISSEPGYISSDQPSRKAS